MLDSLVPHSATSWTLSTGSLLTGLRLDLHQLTGPHWLTDWRLALPSGTQGTTIGCFLVLWCPPCCLLHRLTLGTTIGGFVAPWYLPCSLLQGSVDPQDQLDHHLWALQGGCSGRPLATQLAPRLHSSSSLETKMKIVSNPQTIVFHLWCCNFIQGGCSCSTSPA